MYFINSVRWRDKDKFRCQAAGGMHGFTLVELLLVLMILALIGGLVLPRIIGKAEGAKVKAAALQVDRLAMAVESYYLDTGSTPDNLDLLVSEPGNVKGWNGPYVRASLLKVRRREL